MASNLCKALDGKVGSYVEFSKALRVLKLPRTLWSAYKTFVVNSSSEEGKCTSDDPGAG